MQKQAFCASQAMRVLASAYVFRRTVATLQELLGETPVQKQTPYAG
jgi:hypothetical protein